MNQNNLLLISIAFCILGLTGFIDVAESTPSGPKPVVNIYHVSAPTPAVEKIEHIDSHQLECMALNIYHEARGESRNGRLGVAHVTLNRVANPAYPDNVCDVVKQAVYSRWWWEAKGRKVPVRWKCQFTWFCDGKSDAVRDQGAWQESLSVAYAVMSGKTNDPTGGATHYYNPSLADPEWASTMQISSILDNHTFMKNK